MALCAIVEDQARQRTHLAALLRSAGHETLELGSGAEALVACRSHHPDVVVLDLGLPDVDGLDLIPELLEAAPLVRIVVLTGRDSVATAVASLRSGARHYLVKPWDRDELLVIVDREARAAHIAEAGLRRDRAGVFWGDDRAMARLRGQIERLAAATSTSVLIEGATGTGKEVLARCLHEESRPSGPFVAINCAAVPAELLESELFGHERGAFTTAVARRRGLVELAHEGTLFLDEVAEMPPALQAKLLRYLEDRRFRRVGGEAELASRCRIVSATHHDLEARVAAQAFRADLFFRLAVVRLRVPSLAERSGDLLALATFLLRQLADTLDRPLRALSPSAEQALLRHDWPGNVRELRNRLERAQVLGLEGQIQAIDLDLPHVEVVDGAARTNEAAPLRRLLEGEGWNLARAARKLGIPRHRLRYRVRKLGLRRDEPPF